MLVKVCFNKESVLLLLNGCFNYFINLCKYYFMDAIDSEV